MIHSLKSLAGHIWDPLTARSGADSASPEPLVRSHSICESPEPPSYSFGDSAKAGPKSTPPVYKILKAPRNSAQGKSLRALQQKVPTRDATLELIPDYYSHSPHPSLRYNGARDFFADSEEFEDCGLRAMVSGKALLPPYLPQTANTVNMRAQSNERERPENLRLGVVFHVDATNAKGFPDPGKSTVVMPVLSPRRFFVYTPEAFGKAAAYATKHGMRMPVSEPLLKRFPGAYGSQINAYTDMGRWFDAVYPKLVAAGHGPTYVTDVQEGEALVFQRENVHGTLDFREDWSLLVTFM